MDELLLQPDLTMNETGMLVRTVDERLFRRNLFDSIENVSSCVNTGGPRLAVGGGAKVVDANQNEFVLPEKCETLERKNFSLRNDVLIAREYDSSLLVQTLDSSRTVPAARPNPTALDVTNHRLFRQSRSRLNASDQVPKHRVLQRRSRLARVNRQPLHDLTNQSVPAKKSKIAHACPQVGDKGQLRYRLQVELNIAAPSDEIGTGAQAQSSDDGNDSLQDELELADLSGVLGDLKRSQEGDEETPGDHLQVELRQADIVVPSGCRGNTKRAQEDDEETPGDHLQVELRQADIVVPSGGRGNTKRSQEGDDETPGDRLQVELRQGDPSGGRGNTKGSKEGDDETPGDHLQVELRQADIVVPSGGRGNTKRSQEGDEETPGDRVRVELRQDDTADPLGGLAADEQIIEDDDEADSDLLNDFTLDEYFEPFHNLSLIDDDQNAALDDSTDDDQVDRKPTRQFSLTKRNKALREKGLEYVRANGEKVAARQIRPPCGCRMGCQLKFTDEIRDRMLSKLLALKSSGQNQFLTSHIEVTFAAKHRVVNSQRKYTYLYFLPAVGGRVAVCKIMFAATFDLGKTKIRNLALNVL
ncbi:uncharacterized protein LOC120413501 isoform X2 [Culex pipiens pallens]|nr:uncharacterized protein LOC120413501 isoform X2 [Culex pipiens pallens]